MINKTLEQFYNSPDKELADFMREAIMHYFDMSLDDSQIGITALEKLNDASIQIAITGDTDD